MHSLLEGQLLASGGCQGEAAAVGTGVALPARLSKEHLGLSNRGVWERVGGQCYVLSLPTLLPSLLHSRTTSVLHHHHLSPP